MPSKFLENISRKPKKSKGIIRNECNLLNKLISLIGYQQSQLNLKHNFTNFSPKFPLQTEGSGLFELRLNSFRNEHGKDSLGGCCAQTDRQGSCVGACKTRFRICLKHYQAKIDLTSPCTFGDVVTPVLGENTFNLTKSPYSQANNDASVNLIRFPFEFAWPVSFSYFFGVKTFF